jgi:hypothetical protein
MKYCDNILFLIFILYTNCCLSQIQIGRNINGDSTGVKFGDAIALSYDGNIMIVGAPHFNRDTPALGYVRIFVNNNGTWIPYGNTILASEKGDYFGSNVAISADGNIIAIGASGNSSNGTSYTGQVRVFKYDSGMWVQFGNDIYGSNAEDLSGWSISLSNAGNIIAIGSIQYGVPEKMQVKLEFLKI